MNLLNICLCFGLIAVVFLCSTDAQWQYDQRGVSTSGGRKSTRQTSILPTTTRRSNYRGGVRRIRPTSTLTRSRIPAKRSTANPNGIPRYPPTQYPVTQDRRG